MTKFRSYVQSDVNEPILFRTTKDEVARSTLKTGSLWLRTDQYYREIEDVTRRDAGEGVSSARLGVPLQFALPNAPIINIEGDGSIGQQIVPHYIVSLHGSSISPSQRLAFGGHTVGVRSLSRLSAQILHLSSLLVRCIGYRFGPVVYQHTSLALTHSPIGSAAIQLSSTPPTFLNPISTDALRKEPISPFIEQDEWRVVIFVDRYLDSGPDAPLRINVSTDHFYDYESGYLDANSSH